MLCEWTAVKGWKQLRQIYFKKTSRTRMIVDWDFLVIFIVFVMHVFKFFMLLQFFSTALAHCSLFLVKHSSLNIWLNCQISLKFRLFYQCISHMWVFSFNLGWYFGLNSASLKRNSYILIIQQKQWALSCELHRKKKCFHKWIRHGKGFWHWLQNMKTELLMFWEFLP